MLTRHTKRVWFAVAAFKLLFEKHTLDKRVAMAETEELNSDISVIVLVHSFFTEAQGTSLTSSYKGVSYTDKDIRGPVISFNKKIFLSILAQAH